MRGKIFGAIVTVTVFALLAGLGAGLIVLYITLGAQASSVVYPLLTVSALLITLAVFVAKAFARQITAPFDRLDLDNPLKNNTCEELSPILTHIHAQQAHIAQQQKQQRQLADAFSQSTANLRECLALLDQKGNLLHINPAGKKRFGLEDDCLGKNFSDLIQKQDVSRAVLAALARKHSEVRLEQDGQAYLLDISPVESDRSVIGVVVLAFDVTEQAYAERSRREFTANVSHELKTPLQSIIGSAELLENGLVTPEDTPRFIGHIRREASRLVALIEDIIRLSQLDEGAQIVREPVELQALAYEVVSSLQPAAEAKTVRLQVSGKTAVITGVRRLLYEILYNLCDNAIKYNVPGGSVDVSVTEASGEIVLSVKDTGIGIPPEHHGRVFERFYRVDKSHSKASGGTGLGLSIVKHAALYHHARITLESTPGQGTEICVVFPL